MRLPPLNSLRAFEAAGRHGSVNKAAKELHVTPAAVSHQIKALEEQLGVALFRRLPRRIELTPVGAACLPKLSDAFNQLREAMETVEASKRARTVVVNVPPALGTKWLIHRLPHFTAAHPEVDLRIAVRQSQVDRSREDEGSTSSLLEDGDIAIRMGSGDYPGYAVQKLFSAYTLPMCSPRLLTEGAHPLRVPDDLRYHTLLHYQADSAMPDLNRPTWSRWLKAAGVRDQISSRGITFNQIHLAMQAAMDGIGVMLNTPVIASADLAAGRLVMPFSLSLPATGAYYVVHRPEAEQEPAVIAFRDWLLSEARAEQWAEPPTEDLSG